MAAKIAKIQKPTRQAEPPPSSPQPLLLGDEVAQFTDYTPLTATCQALPEHRKYSSRFRVALKEGGTAPNNPSQFPRELHRRIHQNRARRKPTRLVIVKSRQVHMTTGEADFVVSDSMVDPAVKSAVVSYDDDGCLLARERYKQFIESHPEFSNPDTKPRYNSTEKWESGRNGSSITFNLASAGLGRGGNYRNLHATEADFWKHFEKTMKGLMQGVSDHWLSTVVIETTLGDRPAEGFRSFLQSIRSGRNTDWELWFIAWHEFDDYTAGHSSNTFEWTPQVERALLSSLDEDELFLLHSLKVSPAKLEWRRRTIAGKCLGSKQTFREEYPSTIEEALEAKGERFFSRPAVSWQAKGAVRAMNSYYPVIVDGERLLLSRHTSEIAKHNPADGLLRVWRPTDGASRYRIGADCADSQSPDACFSDLSVVDTTPGRADVVARFSGRIPAFKFAEVLDVVAHTYNDAEVVIDRTGLGVAVAHALERLGTKNLFYCAPRKPGVSLGAETRTELLNLTKELIDQYRIRTYDAEQIEQLRQFSASTEWTGYTDAVFSLALAFWRLPVVAAYSSRASLPPGGSSIVVDVSPPSGYTFEHWRADRAREKTERLRDGQRRGLSSVGYS